MSKLNFQNRAFLKIMCKSRKSDEETNKIIGKKEHCKTKKTQNNKYLDTHNYIFSVWCYFARKKITERESGDG